MYLEDSSLPDPATVSVIRYRLEAVARQVGVAMQQSAISQLLNQAYDFSTAIFDAQGRMVAQAEHIPIHIGAMPLAVRALLSRFEGAIHDGDVLVSNDPYHGGSHAFHVAVRAHHNDIGGAAHGGYNAAAREIYQEGLRIPPLKLVEKGRPREDVLDLLALNVRHAGDFRGDLLAQMGATVLGCRRLEDMLARYGSATVFGALDILLDGTERAMKAEIASWPEGIYEGESLLDDDGRGRRRLPIRARVSLANGEATVDLSGSAEQLDSFLNSSWANTCSAVYVAFMYLTAGRVAVNDGCFRPIRVIAPEGSIVNPRPPAPVGACTTHVGSEIVEAVLLALAPAAPGQSMAGFARRFRYSISGIDGRTGRRYVWHLFYGRGGAGASTHADGWSNLGVIINPGGVRSPSIELTERQFPFFIRRYEFRPDSGGPGKYRGGLGSVFEMRLEGDQPATVNTSGDGVEVPPPGLFGGQPGQPHDFRLISGDEERPVPSKGTEIPLEPGDVLHNASAGGGGYGDPRQRDPRLVARDLHDDLITPVAARD
ncbi:MAG: hydantoinase B/oxoprolinase family protein, partial [Planctomycetota bacterium]